MGKAIENKKVKLEEAKQKILLKEKLLKEIEKKKRIKKFSEVGRIAFKADIDQIDRNVMLGAFLEIAERIKSGESLEDWGERARGFLETSEEKQAAFSVIFSKDPDREIKQIMKDLGFKWNRIRKEFYGYSNSKTLEKALENRNALISQL